MRILLFMYHHIDDIIFRGRNKKYGAYNLRATYDLRLARAMFFSISTFVLIVCAPFLFTREFKVYEIGCKLSPDFDDVIVDYIELENPDVVSGIQMGSNTPATNSQSVPDNFFISNLEPELIKVDSTLFVPGGTADFGDITSNVFGSETGELNGSANGVQGSKGSDNSGVIDEIKVEEVFISVDQMPVFGTGMDDLFAYMSKEIKYPSIARENGIAGTVVIQFVINRNGNVTQVQLVKGIGGGCDQEALRVIKGMPAWSPGKQQGRAVSVRYTLPVKFKLQT
jgi:protein TonB